ncbi:MAG TPA: Gfo/Idh/MocA family oxidoreductase [Tepidisphaeraceae bacterium]|nr:Gfo/Idh/MocA family oxidoreductase [Tepidisphaeraceae bacterium]
MSTTLRWGILGTGNIARQFAGAFGSARRGVLAAVGSRESSSARTFAHTHRVPAHFGSYEQVLQAKDVEAVYISLPNSMHHEWTIRALEAGKHVLCEKPIASNAAQAQEMFDVARRTGRVLMEAFMYRSHPLTHAVLNAIRGGAVGQIRLIRTSFCYRTNRIAGNIRFDPALAGGVLMDVGCYCIDFSRLIAGAEPSRIVGVGRMHASGVDEIAAAMLEFPGDITATFSCGMSVQADNTAQICGTEGFIEIPVPWKPRVHNATWTLAHSTPPKMDLAAKATAPPPRQTFTVSADRELYALEADDFAQSVLDAMPIRVSEQDTLGNMRVLDELRKQIHRGESPQMNTDKAASNFNM